MAGDRTRIVHRYRLLDCGYARTEEIWDADYFDPWIGCAGETVRVFFYRQQKRESLLADELSVFPSGDSFADRHSQEPLGRSIIKASMDSIRATVSPLFGVSPGPCRSQPEQDLAV
jgi:hypothetical protein